MGHQKKLQREEIWFPLSGSLQFNRCAWTISTAIWRTCSEGEKILRPCVWFVHWSLFFIYLLQKVFHLLSTNSFTQCAFLMHLPCALSLGQGRWRRDGSYLARVYNLVWETWKMIITEVCARLVGGDLTEYLGRDGVWGKVVSRTPSQRQRCLSWVLKNA